MNFNNRTLLYDYSELSYLKLPDNNQQIIPDSNGNFSIKFNLNEANYFLLGRNELYLSPGDVLNVIIDNNAPEKSVFRGSGTYANNYLKTVPSPHAGSYLEGGGNIKRTVKESLDTVLQLAQAKRDRLKFTNGLPKAFVAIEKARIEADLFSSFKFLAGFFYQEKQNSGRAERKSFCAVG